MPMKLTTVLQAKEDPMEICKFCALEFMPKVLHLLRSKINYSCYSESNASLHSLIYNGMTPCNLQYVLSVCEWNMNLWLQQHLIVNIGNFQLYSWGTIFFL